MAHLRETGTGGAVRATEDYASFLEYLGYLAYAMPLIPGIMVADYYLLHRGRYTQTPDDVPLVNWRAFWAFAIGLALNLYLGLVADDAPWHTLALVSLALYLVFSWRLLIDAWSRARPAPEERAGPPRFARDARAVRSELAPSSVLTLDATPEPERRTPWTY